MSKLNDVKTVINTMKLRRDREVLYIKGSKNPYRQGVTDCLNTYIKDLEEAIQ